MPTRLAVFASGGGSNLQAIARYIDQREAPSGERVQLALVASDRAGALALEKARASGVPAAHIESPRDATGIHQLLELHQIDVIALAGYLQLVPPSIVREFEGNILNVHPSLLPAFGGRGMYGLKVHEAVIRAGVRISGATVHLVNEEYDRGAILAQWPVPVLDGDTASTLAARVLEVEHLLYPRVVYALATGREIRVFPEPHEVGYAEGGHPAFAAAILSSEELGARIDHALFGP